MLGDNIRSIRKERKLSINKLAELAGVSKGYVSDIENNKATNPTMDKLEKIASALNCNVEYFFKTEPVNYETLEEWDKKYTTQIKEEAEIYTTGEFRTAEAAMQFILKQPAIMGFGGFDINKMTDEEIVEFANELLNQMKLISYKYKK